MEPIYPGADIVTGYQHELDDETLADLGNYFDIMAYIITPEATFKFKKVASEGYRALDMSIDNTAIACVPGADTGGLIEGPCWVEWYIKTSDAGTGRMVAREQIYMIGNCDIKAEA